MRLIERLECPFCKATKFDTIFRVNYSDINLKNFINEYYQSDLLNQVLKNNIYELCDCKICKGIFQKFEPDDNFSIFLYDKIISSENSLIKKNDFIKKNENKLNQDFLMISKLFSKKLDEIKILEFGCGWGFWSKFMKSKSLNITTCEFSKSRHQYLIENKINNIQNLSEINDKFDLIYSEEVLEHVSSPLNILIKLKGLLNENGFMFHRFPSSFFFKKKLNSKYIPKKDCAHPLEHINIINRRCFLEMSRITNLEFCNLLKFKDQKISSKIKMLKNDLIFNNVLLKSKVT